MTMRKPEFFKTVFLLAGVLALGGSWSISSFAGGNATEGDGRRMDQLASQLLDDFCEPHCERPVKTQTNLPPTPEQKKSPSFARDAQDDGELHADDSGSG